VIDVQSEGSGSIVVNKVEDLWANWKEMDISPLGVSESRTGGVRVEYAEAVPGLMEALKGDQWKCLT
jgi:hypothetical protein